MYVTTSAFTKFCLTSKPSHTPCLCLLFLSHSLSLWLCLSLSLRVFAISFSSLAASVSSMHGSTYLAPFLSVHWYSVHNSAYVYHAVYVSTRSAAFSIISAPLVNCLCFCVALLLSLPFAASLSLFLSRPLFLSIALFRCSIWKLSNRLLLSFGL